MPSKQGSVQGRFNLAHLRLSPGIKVKVHVRRFETPIALSDERAEKKRHLHALLKIAFEELNCYEIPNIDAPHSREKPKSHNIDA